MSLTSYVFCLACVMVVRDGGVLVVCVGGILIVYKWYINVVFVMYW